MSSLHPNTFTKLSSSVEDMLTTLSTPVKPWLGHIARCLVVSSFIEDSLRLLLGWGNQSFYLEHYRGFTASLAQLFLALNVMTMLSCSFLAILKRHTNFACAGLGAVIISQSIGYGFIFDFSFLLRHVSVIGGLFMLLADAMVSNSKRSKYFYTGLSSTNETDKSAYIQLGGRVLLVFMFISFVFVKEFSLVRVSVSIVGAAGCLMVVIGYNAKWTAWFLIVFLSVSNVLINSWWNLHHADPQRDFLKYDFFQTVSIMGGFLLLANMGAGGISMDEKKKYH